MWRKHCFEKNYENCFCEIGKVLIIENKLNEKGLIFTVKVTLYSLTTIYVEFEIQLFQAQLCVEEEWMA